MTQWLPELRTLLPLDDADLLQIVEYTRNLPSDEEAAAHLHDLLGDSPQAVAFISDFVKERGQSTASAIGGQTSDTKGSQVNSTIDDTKGPPGPQDAPDHAPPPSYVAATRQPAASSSASSAGVSAGYNPRHTNAVIEAGNERARDEQDMQQALQTLQYQYQIYNAEIEPEHEVEYYCGCPIHQYQRRKINRLRLQKMWSNAVMYPGERFYSDVNYGGTTSIFTTNPYTLQCGSPYGFGLGLGYNYNAPSSGGFLWGTPKPIPGAHLAWIQRTIALSNHLNSEAQRNVDAREPAECIWDVNLPTSNMTGDFANLKVSPSEASEGGTSEKGDSKGDRKGDAKGSKEGGALSTTGAPTKSKSKFSSFKRSLGIKSSVEKASEFASSLRASILSEEAGRWPDAGQRQLVADYQEKVGMSRHISNLRTHKPLQYLHLLRAGYFEPIPVAWANQASNPLKFSIEAREGWRGITPAWRGYEDLAEERLYWVLNHREGSVGMRMKPDFISEMDMAQRRMAAAVEPPPMYFSPDDTCMQQHTSSGHGYSKQVMPTPFRAYDRPEQPNDDSMILLDVSGSMDFDPVRPVYNQYLITAYRSSTQPKNKDVAKSIIRRFTDALAHHDHQTAGYDLVTFSDRATYVGTINHRNFEPMWNGGVRVGGGTRVMTGWQKVKDLHFQKHHESAIHHPVYGWQAGPQTPILRLLLFLDGEATDMDEFELDLLGLSWAHVTIFLIGVDNCPHHHRHANELQRISDVNHHVSFVDAQGNCPERFVTHELLKRHLGYDISLQEFEEMEHLPEYQAVA